MLSTKIVCYWFPGNIIVAQVRVLDSGKIKCKPLLNIFGSDDRSPRRLAPMKTARILISFRKKYIFLIAHGCSKLPLTAIKKRRNMATHNFCTCSQTFKINFIANNAGLIKIEFCFHKVKYVRCTLFFFPHASLFNIYLSFISEFRLIHMRYFEAELDSFSLIYFDLKT